MGCVVVVVFFSSNLISQIGHLSFSRWPPEGDCVAVAWQFLTRLGAEWVWCAVVPLAAWCGVSKSGVSWPGVASRGVTIRLVFHKVARFDVS